MSNPFTLSASGFNVTDDPTPDVPRLRKTLEHIETHPDEWFQEYYVINMTRARELGLGIIESDHPLTMCGTACCYAGQVVLDAGYEFVFEHNNEVSATECIDPATGRRTTIETAARELLGLTPAEATTLFRGSNTAEDLRHWVGEFVKRAGETL